MSAEPEDREMIDQLRRHADRVREQEREGPPRLSQQFARVGVLGWLIVIPVLLAIWIGRKIDLALNTGIMFTGAMLMLGLALGCWSGWKWMHR